MNKKQRWWWWFILPGTVLTSPKVSHHATSSVTLFSPLPQTDWTNLPFIRIIFVTPFVTMQTQLGTCFSFCKCRRILWPMYQYPLIPSWMPSRTILKRFAKEIVQRSTNHALDSCVGTTFIFSQHHLNFESLSKYEYEDPLVFWQRQNWNVLVCQFSMHFPLLHNSPTINTRLIWSALPKSSTLHLLLRWKLILKNGPQYKIAESPVPSEDEEEESEDEVESIFCNLLCFVKILQYFVFCQYFATSK